MIRSIPTLIFSILVLVSTARAQVTIGNPIVTQTGLDSSLTMFVHKSQGFGAGAVGLNISSWSYFGGASGRTLIPLLLELSSGNNYTVRGIGAGVTTALGAQHNLPFNVTTGSSEITNGSFYLGWKESGPTGGSVAFVNSGLLAGYVSGTPSPTVSTSYNFIDLSRTYSISATAIPEPSVTAALCGLAVLGVGLWRRQKISAARLG